MPHRQRNLQRAIDRWHGTIARSAGLGLLAYAALVDRFKNPALLPGAVGLIFLKNITGKNGNGREGGE